MLNLSKLQAILNEIISLATPAKSRDNKILSQNELAVTPNGLNWLFLRPNTAQTGVGVNPPYTDHHTAPKGVLVRFPLMVWLILQNKPIGEYAKRLLIQPRVRPHRPFMGFLLKNELGAFPC